MATLQPNSPSPQSVRDWQLKRLYKVLNKGDSSPSAAAHRQGEIGFWVSTPAATSVTSRAQISLKPVWQQHLRGQQGCEESFRRGNHTGHIHTHVSLWSCACVWILARKNRFLLAAAIAQGLRVSLVCWDSFCSECASVKLHTANAR